MDGGRIVENVLDVFGCVDVVVNNVGILCDKIFYKMEDVDWDLVYQVYVEGVYKVICVVWLYLCEQVYGWVVFIFLILGIYGNFGQSNYGMVKFGFYGLICILVLEGCKNNILVNVIVFIGGMWMIEGLILLQVFEQFKLELVSLLVVYFGSLVCEDILGFYEVGGGWIGKVCWECSLGFGFDLKVGFDVEDVVVYWQQICDFENVVYLVDNVEVFCEMMVNLQKYVF